MLQRGRLEFRCAHLQSEPLLLHEGLIDQIVLVEKLVVLVLVFDGAREEQTVATLLFGVAHLHISETVAQHFLALV